MEAVHGYAGTPAPLGRVLVLGLGTSGGAALRYLAPLVGGRVEALTVMAGKRTPKSEAVAAAYAEMEGVSFVFDSETVEGAFDLCIASPGISEFSDFYQSAAQASREVISEVEFAWRESPADARWVAVTGTNGKTTVTSLIAHVLKSAGLRAAACGNIGDTCIDAVALGEVDVFVAEVSSYQLASTRQFAPNAAVVLNITPDHLKWHRSMENYAAAKFKAFANLAQVEGAVCVLDATNDIVRAQVRAMRAQAREERGFAYVPLGTAGGLSCSMRNACGSENAAWLADERLRVDFGDTAHDLGAADNLQIKGAHNASNALAAGAVALALGLDDEAVRAGLASFAPLEHRIEPCGTVRGVRCYNDSKATNVDATLKALAAFGEVRPIVLLGGDDKGTDLTELVAAAREHCSAVVCYGAAGERFYEAFTVSTWDKDADALTVASTGTPSASLAVLRAEHMADAFEVALSVAREGDVIALSPACASFDEFSCFEERGETFKRLVSEQARKEGA